MKSSRISFFVVPILNDSSLRFTAKRCVQIFKSLIEDERDWIVLTQGYDDLLIP